MKEFFHLIKYWSAIYFIEVYFLIEFPLRYGQLLNEPIDFTHTFAFYVFIIFWVTFFYLKYNRFLALYWSILFSFKFVLRIVETYQTYILLKSLFVNLFDFFKFPFMINRREICLVTHFDANFILLILSWIKIIPYILVGCNINHWSDISVIIQHNLFFIRAFLF